MAAVPAEGGLLSYEVLDGATEPALAIHGVSTQEMSHGRRPERCSRREETIGPQIVVGACIETRLL
jgi:hypothetical protein